MDNSEPFEASQAGYEPARYTLMMFSNHAIDRGLVAMVRRQLEDEVRESRDLVEIDIWLESPGGDAHAAFKLGTLLRCFASCIRVVVPDYAKSAATLLTIGADEIFMGPGAELGPLDAQIPNEGAAVSQISALDIARSVDELAQTAMAMAVAGGAQILQTTGLSRADTLSAMLEFSSSFMEPIVRQLDPTMMHWSSSLLKVAPEYAARLLEGRQQPSTQRARALAHRLVEDYPTHGFVITEHEARRLGLPVFPMADYDLAEQVRSVHRAFEDAGDDLVRLVATTDILKPGSTLADEDGGHLPSEHPANPADSADASAADAEANEEESDGDAVVGAH